MIFDDFDGIAAEHARLFSNESEPPIPLDELDKSPVRDYELPIWTEEEIRAAEAA